MKRVFVFSILAGLFLLASCQKDKDEKKDQGWSDKLLVINEGPFQSGTGSITAYDRETGEVTQDLFERVNGRPLGNIVTSMKVHGDYAYIVVNNSNKVEVVDKVSFESRATIEGLSFPAYMECASDSKGYVSCMDGTVKVIDLAGFQVVSSVAAGAGPDRMLLAGDLWVLNGGGFASDSTVTVIDVTTDAVKRTLVPGPVPSGIVQDRNGDIWILCSGTGWNGWPAPGDTPGRLVCYDPETFAVIREFEFPSSDIHPDNLLVNNEGTLLYYNHPSGLFAFGITAAQLPDQPLVKRSLMLYGIGYDPVTGRLMGADAVDYVQNGWAYFYDPASGTPLDSFQTGVIPNGFWTGE